VAADEVGFGGWVVRAVVCGVGVGVGVTWGAARTVVFAVAMNVGSVDALGVASNVGSVDASAADSRVGSVEVLAVSD
jgi:hypothetical protein